MIRQADHPALNYSRRALFDFVERLTRKPGDVEEEDLKALRLAGYGDSAIGDIVLVTALFAFMNRLVDGLGGLVEGDMLERARRYGLPTHPGTFEHLDAQPET